MTPQEIEYFKRLAKEFVREIAPPAELKAFVNSPPVTGAYVECAVRSFIKKIVKSGSISTGAVISPELCLEPKDVPQIDTIIWTSSPYPAVFENENFAIVPRQSVYGVIEIKSTDYTRAVESIAQRVSLSKKLLSDGLEGFGKGVICINTGKHDREKLAEMTEAKVCFVLFNETDSIVTPNEVGIISFIQYLAQVEYHLRSGVAMKAPNDDLLKALSS